MGVYFMGTKTLPRNCLICLVRLTLFIWSVLLVSFTSLFRIFFAKPSYVITDRNLVPFIATTSLENFRNLKTRAATRAKLLGGVQRDIFVVLIQKSSLLV